MCEWGKVELYRLPHKNVAFLYGSSEDAVEALITEIIASVSMGRALAVDNMNRQAGRVIYQDALLRVQILQKGFNEKINLLIAGRHGIIKLIYYGL